MSYATLSEIKRKIEVDMDIEGEDFVQTSEFTRYINDAIRDAEASIHTLYEDYFLSSASLALVSGTEEYAMPADIYAMKLRGLIYVNGAKIYEITRVRDWRKFVEYSINNFNNTSTDDLQYFVKNAVAGSPKILINPIPRESGSFVTVWYLRRANALSADADICDIPEFLNFVYAHVKLAIAKKEIGNPLIPKFAEELEAERATMVGTLANMTPDYSNELEPDMRLYEEMS